VVAMPRSRAASNERGDESTGVKASTPDGSVRLAAGRAKRWPTADPATTRPVSEERASVRARPAGLARRAGQRSGFGTCPGRIRLRASRRCPSPSHGLRGVENVLATSAASPLPAGCRAERRSTRPRSAPRRRPATRAARTARRRRRRRGRRGTRRSRGQVPRRSRPDRPGDRTVSRPPGASLAA
jgi:hypothetical protein